MERVQILDTFEPITLAEMEGVKLMNRTDTKFVFPFSRLEGYLSEIRSEYKILSINGVRLCRYETLYYDSADLKLYLAHHSGKLNRYKVRHRTYVDSGAGFLEVKFKSNKGRTNKTRIPSELIMQNWSEENENFLRKMLPFDPHILQPVIWVNYHRYTLVNKNGLERVTLDLGLEFRKNEQTQRLERMVIAEVKQDRRAVSPFIELMKRHHIREGSISKYCMGMAFTSDQLKKNNFKLKLRAIKKLNLC